MQTKTCKKDHGSWFFRHDVPTYGTQGRNRIKRGGFLTKDAAEAALAESLAKYIQRGVAAERDLKGRRQLVGDYLANNPDLKPSTRRSYERNIVNHLIKTAPKPARPRRRRVEARAVAVRVRSGMRLMSSLSFGHLSCDVTR